MLAPTEIAEVAVILVLARFVTGVRLWMFFAAGVAAVSRLPIAWSLMLSVMFACGLLIGVNLYRDAQLPLKW